MTKYILAYHGGSMPQTPEDGAKVMKAWNDWMGTLGKSLVDGGNPTGKSRIIAPGGKVAEGGGANAVSGYSIIEASNLDDAVELAKGCPQISAGGSIEIGELVTM
ncbi:MAG: hypothetical protein ABL866_12095 [Devosia sp.]